MCLQHDPNYPSRYCQDVISYMWCFHAKFTIFLTASICAQLTASWTKKIYLKINLTYWRKIKHITRKSILLLGKFYIFFCLFVLKLCTICLFSYIRLWFSGPGQSLYRNFCIHVCFFLCIWVSFGFLGGCI